MVAPPQRHAIIVTVLCALVLCIGLIGRAPHQQANAASVPVSIPDPAPPAPTAPPTPPPSLPTPSDITAPVRSGDNLAKIFMRHGFGAGDLQMVLDSGPHGKRLAAIMPGHEFDFTADDDGNLKHLTYRLDRLQSVRFRRVRNRFEATEIVREPDRVRIYRSAKIENEQSLFTTCKELGLSDRFATRLADIFKWDIDFILDVRPGATSSMCSLKSTASTASSFATETSSRPSSSTGAARIPPCDTPIQTVWPASIRPTVAPCARRSYAPRWTSHGSVPDSISNGSTRCGNAPCRIEASTTRRPPVRQSRRPATVSSRTNPAPGQTATNVVIQHGARYQTKYLHLSRFAANLAEGQAVTQGQTIGRVGATGWATGPHLHYEFLVDGVHHNPSTASMPKAEPITVVERDDFHSATTPLLADLQDRKTDHLVSFRSPVP